MNNDTKNMKNMKKHKEKRDEKNKLTICYNPAIDELYCTLQIMKR